MADSDLKAILRALTAQGWSFKRGRRNHIQAISPDKSMPIVLMASTPSDLRALANIRAMLRRSGARV